MQLELPQDYVDLMKTRNGGSLARTIFKLNEEEISVEYLFGIGKSENEGVLTTLYMREEWDLRYLIILQHYKRVYFLDRKYTPILHTIAEIYFLVFVYATTLYSSLVLLTFSPCSPK